MNEVNQRTSQLELAREVQLPKNALTIAGWSLAYRYLPFDVVSGDYLDVVEHGVEAFYFALGDVSGKGIAASLMMSHLHATVRALLPMGYTIEEVMRRVSRTFCETSRPAQFATLVLGRAERQGHVRIVNAGHTPVLVIRSGNVETVGATGLPLGLFCTTVFESTPLDLSDGATIVIYSDGVSEALESDGPDCSSGRLCDLVRNSATQEPAELLTAIDSELTKYGSPRFDDETILILRSPGR